MSYQKDRGECIALLTKHGMPYHAIETLLRAATTINRLAELACSSEAADRDRIPCPAATTIVKQYGSARRPPLQTRIIKRKAIGPCLCDGQYIDHAVTDGGPSEKVYQHADIPRIRLQDWQAEQRVQRVIDQLNAPIIAWHNQAAAGPKPDPLPIWRIVTSGDPRGYTLRVVPPAYAEENKTRSEHAPRTIGIPPGPSRLRW